MYDRQFCRISVKLFVISSFCTTFSFQIQMDNILRIESRIPVITFTSDLVFYNQMEDPIKTEHPPGLREVNT